VDGLAGELLLLEELLSKDCRTLMPLTFLLVGDELASSGFRGLPMGWHFDGEVPSRHFEWTHL